MWPTREETDRLLDGARSGEPGAVDRLLGEFREPLRRVIDLRLDPALARRLADAVNQLSDDDRDIILMRHHEALSNQEVAGLLGLTEAAASMRYLRALRRLRAVLVPDGGDPSPDSV